MSKAKARMGFNCVQFHEKSGISSTVSSRNNNKGPGGKMKPRLTCVRYLIHTSLDISKQ